MADPAGKFPWGALVSGRSIYELSSDVGADGVGICADLSDLCPDSGDFTAPWVGCVFRQSV